MTSTAPQPTPLEIQDGMWIEMIRTIETMFANLVSAQIDSEQKSEELREAHEFAHNVIHSMANALVVTDGEGRITLVNEACLRLLDAEREALIGQPLVELLADPAAPSPVPGAPLWQRLLSQGAVREVETLLCTPAGVAIPVHLNVAILRDRLDDVVGVVLAATDLRETKRLLAQARSEAIEAEKAYRELKMLQATLIQAEKMSSLGRMAASVAHEINNPLGAILVYSHLMHEALPAGDPQGETLRKIIRETQRCKEIVQGLLGLARTQHSSLRRRFDVNPLVARTFDLLRQQSLFKNLGSELDLSPESVELEGEEGPLQQALMNIMVNAAEAMKGEGRMIIRTRRDQARSTVLISITDTGPGIPREVQDRLFEPFFTTKREGHGTGLGLAITYNIVKLHGGSIQVLSEPGQGATFTLSFPTEASPAGGAERP